MNHHGHGNHESTLRRGARRRRGEGKGQDFELNLASVIDCLTVLIAFVLVSASFVSIGILDAEVAAGAASSGKPELGLVVALHGDHTIQINLTGSSRKRFNIGPSADGKSWDYDAYSDRLAFIKGEHPGLKSAVLEADSAIGYREVVKSMEITRMAVPTVMLGGF